MPGAWRLSRRQILAAALAIAPAGAVPVTWDKRSLFFGGRRAFVWAGEFHTFRLPSPSLWRDVLQKMRAIGFNTVTYYIP